MMTTTNEPHPISIPSGTTAILAAAAILIVFGIVLQMAKLGYGRIRPDNFWLFLLVGTSLWNMFAARGNMPGFFQLLQFWPMLLVTLGLGIFLAKH